MEQQQLAPGQQFIGPQLPYGTPPQQPQFATPHATPQPQPQPQPQPSPGQQALATALATALSPLVDKMAAAVTTSRQQQPSPQTIRNERDVRNLMGDCVQHFDGSGGGKVVLAWKAGLDLVFDMPAGQLLTDTDKITCVLFRVRGPAQLFVRNVIAEGADTYEAVMRAVVNHYVGPDFLNSQVEALLTRDMARNQTLAQFHEQWTHGRTAMQLLNQHISEDVLVRRYANALKAYHNRLFNLADQYIAAAVHDGRTVTVDSLYRTLAGSMTAADHHKRLEASGSSGSAVPMDLGSMSSESMQELIRSTVQTELQRFQTQPAGGRGRGSRGPQFAPRSNSSQPRGNPPAMRSDPRDHRKWPKWLRRSTEQLNALASKGKCFVCEDQTHTGGWLMCPKLQQRGASRSPSPHRGSQLGSRPGSPLNK